MEKKNKAIYYLLGLHLSELGRKTGAVDTPAETSQDIGNLVLYLLPNTCHQH